ncbi:MAG: protein kinase [Oscillospiraceae bacterium]|jgi:serine/threonine-protein kinase|nr:protein kinase [Oscillospiraceae bacterium]
MQNEDLRLCMGCMNYVDNSDATCKVCGTNRYKGNSREFLKAGSTLGTEYLVGCVHSYDGEHVIYVGKDLVSGRACLIKEYFPSILSSRLQTGELVPKLSSEVQHKTFMVDFLDLHQTLKQLNAFETLVKIENIMVCNKTVYVIYPKMELISLAAYLEKHQKLSWENAKRWLFSLNHLLINVHNNGIIHRGISPQTIYLDSACENIFLWDFSIPPVRTKNTQIRYQLFEGYSAPEQYFSNKWQGEWTDVYSMACVLLKMLTGHTLKELPEDFFVAPSKLNEKIPAGVLDTISRAICKDRQERTQTIRQFNSGLLADCRKDELAGDATVVFDASSASLNQNKVLEIGQESNPESDKTSRSKSKGFPWVSVFIGSILVVGFAIYFALSWMNEKREMKPQKMEISRISEKLHKKNESLKLENFVAKSFDEVAKSVDGKITFNATHEFDDITEAGSIVRQDPLPGTLYDPTGPLTVNVIVSKGPELVKLPQVRARDVDELTKELDALGVKYEKFYGENDDVEVDVVYDSNRRDYEEIAKNADKVLLYVKKNKERSEGN